MEGQIKADVIADGPVVLLGGADPPKQVRGLAEHVVPREGFRAALAACLRNMRADVVQDQPAHELRMARGEFNRCAAAQR